VTATEYRKALLLARIEAHRSVVRLELRCARATLDPVSELLALVGVDRGLVGAAVGALRGLAGGTPEHLHGGAAIVPLVVAALLPLVSGLRSEEGTSAVIDKEPTPG
jgi:hypothetical protein